MNKNLIKGGIILVVKILVVMDVFIVYSTLLNGELGIAIITFHTSIP